MRNNYCTCSQSELTVHDRTALIRFKLLMLICIAFLGRFHLAIHTAGMAFFTLTVPKRNFDHSAHAVLIVQCCPKETPRYKTAKKVMNSF